MLRDSCGFAAEISEDAVSVTAVPRRSIHRRVDALTEAQIESLTSLLPAMSSSVSRVHAFRSVATPSDPHLLPAKTSCWSVHAEGDSAKDWRLRFEIRQM